MRENGGNIQVHSGDFVLTHRDNHTNGHPQHGTISYCDSCNVEKTKEYYKERSKNNIAYIIKQK